MNGAHTRAFGASAAIVVLAGLPILLGASTTNEPAPVKGTLTVDLSGAQGDSKPYLIETRGPSPPPTHAVMLRDASGLNVAGVEPETGPCTGASKRVSFPGENTPWCFRLVSVAAGHELSGQLVNANGDALVLAVRRRDAFWWSPLLVLLGGLIAGFLVALVPRWLRERVRWTVLNDMISKNESGAEARRIDGLREWTQTQHTQGADRETLIAVVNRVTTSGSDRADEARERLGDAIDGAPASLHTHELLENAAKIRDRKVNRMCDFFDRYEIEPRTQHPADAWAVAVGRLVSIRSELDDQERAIDDIGAEYADDPREKLRIAKTRFEHIKKPDDMETIASRLDALRLAIDEARARSERAMREEQQSVRVASLRARAGPSLELTAGALAFRKTVAGAATAVIALIALAYAFVTVKQVAYETKPLFHSFGDYVALFSAALGSGAAAAVLGLLANWRPSSQGNA